MVRGEAALVLAAGHDPRSYDAILAVAKDEEPDARLRGLLALGYLGVAGSEHLLESALADSATRVHPDGVVAAFALGLLPGGSADTAITLQLGRFLESSYKRQRDLVLAMTTAMTLRSPRAQRLALRHLIDDAALRDDEVRAAVWSTLGRIPDGLDPYLPKVLERGSAPERRAVLAALAAEDAAPAADLAPRLMTVGRRDRDPAVRAQALAVLTRMRHLPALDLAARLLRADTAVEVAQATRTHSQLGGAPLRRVVERQLEFLDQDGQAALLRNYSGPMSAEFERTCRHLADSDRSPPSLRRAAVLALAQAGVDDVADQLDREFLAARATEDLVDLARARQRLEPPMPLPRDLLTGDAAALDLAGRRLAALLAAGHAEASRACVETLQVSTDRGRTAAVLRAIRSARLPQVPDRVRGLVPEPVAGLLR
ncbi:MAG: hypothetical protein AB7O97_17775 [Planctomycetota bacterium]